MKHSPEIALTSARNALDSARDNCPHWDYESNDRGGDHECCFHAENCKLAYKRARLAVTRLA